MLWSTYRVNALVDANINWTIAIRDFKARLFVLLERCQAVAELPAALLDHIRREAGFFLTMLYRLKGLPVPPEEVLGIPNANIPTSLVPKLLIPYMGEQVPPSGQINAPALILDHIAREADYYLEVLSIEDKIL